MHLEQLAYNISFHRNQNNWTQRELGEMLSVSRSVIGKWENALAVPDAEALLKMSRLFHVTTDHLLGNPLYQEEMLKDYQELYKGTADEVQPTEATLDLIHYILTHPEFRDMITHMKQLPIKRQHALQKIFAQLVELAKS